MALSAWQAAPLADAGLAVAAALYLAASWRVRRWHPGHPWPLRRAAAFFAGLGVVAVATQSAAGVYDGVLFSAHMVQHVLLIMVAPPLLVYGRPVTLLLHAVHNPWHSRVKRLLRSACSRALTWPAAATALYAVVVAGTHTPPVMGLVLRDGAAHDGEHLLYLAAGYLFFLPVVGSEPVPWRLGTLGRYLMLVAGMQVDSAVGVLLWVQQHEVFPAYARTARPAGLSPLADLHVGGMVMWAGSDVVMALLAIALALALVAPRRPGRTGEASAATLAAHNSYVQSLSLGQATPSGEP